MYIHTYVVPLVVKVYCAYVVAHNRQLLISVSSTQSILCIYIYIRTYIHSHTLQSPYVQFHIKYSRVRSNSSEGHCELYHFFCIAKSFTSNPRSNN